MLDVMHYDLKMTTEGSLAALGMTKLMGLTLCAESKAGVIPSAARDLFVLLFQRGPRNG
jgi:hypothetical protein